MLFKVSEEAELLALQLQRNASVGFTGHRSIPLDEQPLLACELEFTIRELLARGFYNFITGGALGFDTLAAQAALSLHEEFSQLRLVVIAPYAGQCDGWSEADRRSYMHIARVADDFICLQQNYDPDCMRRRNQCIVDMSRVCVAYMKRPRSGAGQTVRMAKKQSLEVINLAERISAR